MIREFFAPRLALFFVPVCRAGVGGALRVDDGQQEAAPTLADPREDPVHRCRDLAGANRGVGISHSNFQLRGNHERTPELHITQTGHPAVGGHGCGSGWIVAAAQRGPARLHQGRDGRGRPAQGVQRHGRAGATGDRVPPVHCRHGAHLQRARSAGAGDRAAPGDGRQAANGGCRYPIHLQGQPGLDSSALHQVQRDLPRGGRWRDIRDARLHRTVRAQRRRGRNREVPRPPGE